MIPLQHIRNWWHSLSIQFRMHLLIQTCLLVIMLLAQRWILHHFEDQILQSTESRAVEAADGVINGMNMLMLTGKIQDSANRMLFIRKMGSSAGISSLRIIRADQVKRQFGPGLPEEQAKDAIDRKVLETGQTYFGKADLAQPSPSLRVVVPFIASTNFRGTNCLMCHHVEVGSVNGAASIVIDLSKEKTRIEEINAFLWAGQIGLQGALFIVIGLLLRSFTAPVKALQQVMSAMQADGDLSRRVDIAGNDEIGQIAGAFNSLAGTLEESVQQVHDYAHSLEESEGRFRQMAENIKQVFWMSDSTRQKMLYVSPAFEEIWGIPYDRLDSPDSLLETVHPEDRARVAEALSGMAQGNCDITYRIVRPDGQIRWIRDRAFPVRNEKGKLIRITGIAEDITVQKQTEEQLSLSAQVFVNSQEAIMITDSMNNIIKVNQAFTDITGYSEMEVIGKNPRILKSGRHESGFYQSLWQTLLSTGNWHGEVWDRRKNGEIYPKWVTINIVRNELGEISNFIALFSDITERKASFDRIQRLAHYDTLTNLPNRSLLNERLESAIAGAKRNGLKIGILFLDLDRFKNVNDSLGHFAGDLLLQTVANRLKRCVRDMDTVARLGGDEFVIILNGIKDAADAAHVAQKILESLSEPVMIENQEIVTTPSMGISIYPDDGQNHTTLIKNADAAMYHAKDLGRGNFQFFTQNMNEKAFKQLSFESDLKLALKRAELFLDYQPQIDIRSGRLVGMEALLRWRHPEKGLIPPSVFIPVAEECGAIVAMGEWVIRAACNQNRIWQAAGLPVVPVAVNLSAVQFRQKDIVDAIKRILEETGLSPSLLELEMTEGIIMEDADTTIGTLRAIKEMGLRLSIDDFGTGYSSLSYLKRFPIDKLKIDQSFVRDIATNQDDAAIIRTIITMGHSLRLQVIAEGVETLDQLAFLKEEGCDEAQGYHFGRPMPASQFEALLGKKAGPRLL